MQCDVCHRPANGQLHFNCELCAQAAVYQPRLRLAQSLLENETLEKDVEGQLVGSRAYKVTARGHKIQGPHPSWTIERARVDQATLDQSTEDIQSHVKALRDEVQHMKLDIAKRKAKLVRRRKDLASPKERSPAATVESHEQREEDAKLTIQRWEDVHQETVIQRMARCAQTARVYSLQQHKWRKGSVGNDMYSIGFIPTPDLKELNNAEPGQISASLLHLARLVHLTAHYLSLKPPAQMILPTSDYPYPTILSPNVSYMSNDLNFPGSTPSSSSNPSPEASRHVDPRALPRARPLFLKKKLLLLAKTDPLAYAHFVEGITLLAWDIAWICKAQGMDVGNSSWEDVCAVGRNLWQLLLSPQIRPPPSRTTSRRTMDPIASSPGPSATVQDPPSREGKPAPPPRGFFSHGTVYGFLAAASGTEYMRDWKLQNPVKVIDKVKAMLLAERTGAEWEILQGNDWEAEAAANDIAGQGDAHGTRIEETGILVRPGDDLGAADEAAKMGGREDGKAKGTTGWTKLKSR